MAAKPATKNLPPWMKQDMMTEDMPMKKKPTVKKVSKTVVKKPAKKGGKGC